MDNLTDINQMQNGFNYQFERVREEIQWDQWYAGNYQSMLPQKSIDNGLMLFALQDLIRWNPIRVLVDTIRWGAISDQPALIGNNSALQSWLDQNSEYLFRQMQASAEFWSLKDRSIAITFDNGSMDIINPTAYHRIGRPYDPDNLVGHIICQFEVEQTRDVLLNPAFQRNPTHVRVTRYMPSADPPINDVQVFKYSGDQGGGFFSEPDTEREPAGIQALSVIGRGLSWVGQAKDAIARHLIRLTNDDRALNRHYAAPLAMPSSFQTVRPGSAPSIQTPKEQLDGLTSQVNGTILVDEQAFPPTWIRDDLPFESSDALTRTLLFIIQITSGVSQQVLGFDLSGNHSGVAIGRMSENAGNRCRLWRYGWQHSLPEHIAALGAPAGEVSVLHPVQPFEDRDARIQRLIELYNAGKGTTDPIITGAEVRAAIGFAPMATEDTPTDPESGTEGNDGNT